MGSPAETNTAYTCRPRRRTSRRASADSDASSRSSGGISFEAHASLFLEELSAMADKKTSQEEVPTEVKAVAHENNRIIDDDIINRLIPTSSGVIARNDSNLSLLSIAEDVEGEQPSSLIRNFEQTMIDRHMKAGRLRRVVSSTDALSLRKHRTGQLSSQGTTQPEGGTRRIRTVVSFNKMPPSPSAAVNKDHSWGNNPENILTSTSNASFGNHSKNNGGPDGPENPLQLRRSRAAVTAGNALLRRALSVVRDDPSSSDLQGHNAVSTNGKTASSESSDGTETCTTAGQESDISLSAL